MDEYLNYFEQYYKMYYNGFDFYCDDSKFGCRFPGDLKGEKLFRFTLLSPKAYHLMQHYGVLDRYLEIMKLKYSVVSRDIGIRVHGSDYTLYIEESIQDNLEEILPYLGTRFDETFIQLSNFSMIFMKKGRGMTKRFRIMDGDLYVPGEMADFKVVRSEGELEEADLILVNRFKQF